MVLCTFIYFPFGNKEPIVSIRGHTLIRNTVKKQRVDETNFVLQCNKNSSEQTGQEVMCCQCCTVPRLHAIGEKAYTYVSFSSLLSISIRRLLRIEIEANLQRLHTCKFTYQTQSILPPSGKLMKHINFLTSCGFIEH
jgi:hypothetical protein